MLINKFYSNVSEENKISAENMTNTEKEVARRAIANRFISFIFIYSDIVNPQSVFGGLVAMRCELLPQIEPSDDLAHAFQTHLHIEHLFHHDVLAKDRCNDCDFMRAAEDVTENSECNSMSRDTEYHSSIFFEYMLTD